MNKHKHHKDVEGDNIFKSTIILFGNPDFKKGHDGSNVKAIAGRQSSVDPLLGAEKEVTDLEAFMKANHWDTQLYIGADATEDEVKEMESPTVFHLATHGFFIDEDPGAHHSSHESNNPLMKAGLMFTGAASLITEQNLYNLNKQEGILTAYEAMNLHLDNTELVVLSSCETSATKRCCTLDKFSSRKICSCNTFAMSLKELPRLAISSAPSVLILSSS